jgi:NitT/TauT family transport system substrate-binding protein
LKVNSRRLGALVAALCVVLTVAGCGGGDDSAATAQGTGAGSSLKRVKIAVPTIGSAFVNLLVAKDAGIFKKNGLEVQLVVMAAPTIAPALVKGDVDLTATIPSAENAARAGLPLKVVMVSSTGADFAIVAPKSIASPQALRGKSFATGPATSGPGVLSNALLTKWGISNDVRLTAIDAPTTRVTQLGAGRIDSALLNLDGALHVIDQNPDLHLLATPQDFPPLAFTGLAGTTKRLSEDPEMVDAAIKSLLEAGKLLQDEPERANAVIGKVLHLNPEQAEQVRALMADRVAPDGVPSDAVTASGARIASTSAGKTLTVADMKKNYDFTQVEKVAQQLGQSG